MKEQCRVCASELKGTQRRWIFNTRTAVNLQVVLSHVLGQQVTRDGESEFLCGKCAFSLERVYRFDTVIARVQALSIEKIQRLLMEKDRLVQCLSYHHKQQHPSAKEQDITSDSANLPRVQYNALLQDDLVMSEYECWSEHSRSDLNPCVCQHKNCSGCSAIRVSDSTYESVCKIPRRLARALAKGHLFQLSKKKSQSMPLDWLRAPEQRASSCSSVQSLYTDGPDPSSRSLSVSSLGAGLSSDRESEDQVFDDSMSPSSTLDQSLAAMVQWIRGISYRPVHTLPSSKIPIHIRNDARATSSCSETPRRRLSFGRDEGSFWELKSEFSAEYLPFNLEKFLKHESKPDGLQETVRQLNEQLQAARNLIQTLEGRLKDTDTSGQELGLQTPGKSHLGLCSHGTKCQQQMIQHLACELHSKEQLLQECVELLKQMASGARSVTDVNTDMVEKLRARLKERDEALERSADERFAAIEERETEVEQLRVALREKDRDLSRLGDVLTCNEDMINMLNHTMKKKDNVIKQLETLCESLKEVWSQRDEERMHALREKDRIIAQLQTALQNCAKDLEALTDSLLSQGLEHGSDSSTSLYLQLKDKEQLLSQVLSEWNRKCAKHEKVIEELLNKVADKDRILKEMSDHHLEKLAIQAQENLLEDGREKDRVLTSLQGQLHDSMLLKVTMKQTL
ncbi:myosin-11 isoform X2 [Heterodontus francisci]|uniref:myosin-11 isoform X2 n=1 Tax=Heterodontus francisci TaxID=7792 RepID=UPI00355C047F